MPQMTRRTAILSACCALSGCSAISAINASTAALDTFDLSVASGLGGGRRTSRTLLVATPQASAVLATDRIMVRPATASVTYLPDARWGDELPKLVQSLLIRSMSSAGRVGYVGPMDAGPVADKALLVRIDAFEVRVVAVEIFEVAVDLHLTMVNDRDQRVVGTQAFRQTAQVGEDDAETIVAGFQRVLDVILPQVSDWALARV